MGFLFPQAGVPQIQAIMPSPGSMPGMGFGGMGGFPGMQPPGGYMGGW